MKRVFVGLLFLSACATTAPRSAGNVGHRMAFAAPQASVDTNQLRVFKGTPPAPPAGTVAIISNDGTSLLQQNSDGTTSTLGGGGGGTVQTAAPVSGDGSSGNKVTIAAGALPLSAIATQAAQTFTMNCTGSTASPGACSGSSLNSALTTAGAAPSWVLARRAAAQACSATLASEWYSELATSADWANTADSGGGGTGTALTTVNGGVIQGSTATQSAHSAWLSPAGHYPLVSDISNTAFYSYWRVRFEGPSGANSQVFVVEGNWSAGALVSQFSFGIDGTFQTGGSNSNFVIRLYNGTTNTVTATSTAIDTASYHDVEMCANGTTVTITYDGVAVNQTFTQSGVGSGKTGTIGTAIFSNDTTSRLIDVDKMYTAFAAQ